MSTRHTDVGKDQETTPRTSQSIFTENTVHQEKVPSSESFSQPPRRPSRTQRARWFLVAAVIVALAIIFSVFALVIP